MTMEDVWVETVHETERRNKKEDNSAAGKQKESAQGRKKRPAARKGNRERESKRAA
jgi:hypothetical protein